MATQIVLLSANTHREPYAVYPLGTAYLKCYLDNNLPNSIVEVFDMNTNSTQDLQAYLVEKSVDFVCISIRNVDGANSLDRRGFLPQYKKIVDAVKEVTSVPIIIGGAGFSIFPSLFMQEMDADYGISGEGERALCNLITALKNNTSVDFIPKLYRKSERVNKLECNYIELPQSKYETDLVEYYWHESGMLNIQTKRGCPYKCIYCTYPQIDGSKVRCMNIDSIVETIAKAKRDFGANYWFFTDSVFNIKNSYNIKLAQALIDSGVDIQWGAYFSPSNITDEQMALFKASGLTHIEFGTESFCDETLESYGKHFTYEDVLKSSKIALKNNIFYSHFLILAGWGETQAHLEETIRNSKQLEYTVIFPYVGMRIYPNTILHKSMLESNLLLPDDTLLEPSYYITEGFNLEHTKQLAKATEKAWIFPDEPTDNLVNVLKYKRKKKGPLWEYLRKP